MYGMRFAQIAQDMCNYLDAQTKDLAPNEALVAKKMIIRKLCRGEGLDDMIAPQSALSTKRKQPAGPNVARSVLITLDIGHCRLRCALPVLTLCQPARRVEFVQNRRVVGASHVIYHMHEQKTEHLTKEHTRHSTPPNGNRPPPTRREAMTVCSGGSQEIDGRKLTVRAVMKALAGRWLWGPLFEGVVRSQRDLGR